MPDTPPTILSLTTTVARADDAQRLARALLGQRLVACVQVEAGLVSHYRWQGAVHEDAEWRLTLKTLPEALPDLLGFMDAQHPYDTPQLLWQELESSDEYAQWVRSQVSLPPTL